MRAEGWVLGLLVGVVMAVVTTAEAQYATPYQSARRYYGSVNSRVRVARLRNVPGALDSRRHVGAQTRFEQLRSAFSFRNTGQGLVLPETQSIDPIRNSLDQRNLLRPHSLIARRVAGRVGRLDYLRDETGHWQGEIRPFLSVEPGPQPITQTVEHATLEDRLAARLRQQADENFDLGLAYYREGKLVEAANCMSLVKDIDRYLPRGYAADVFIAFSNECYYQAILSTLRAMSLAKTLDDLEIDRFIERMYPGADIDAQRREFRRHVEAVNMYVTSNPDVGQSSVLLAYFAWLNGDLGTAISAAETTEKGLDPYFARGVARFRRLLLEARDGRSAPSPGS